MQRCTIYHTGVYNAEEGIIKDNKIYIQRQDNNLYFPEEMFMAREECDGGLIQFEVEGKWGFANIYTGEIVIEPVWDYGGPFYGGYAHVALGVQPEINGGYYIEVNGGKHGYIDTNGRIIIPLEYDYAADIRYRKYFEVNKNGKWGLIDNQNKTIIPLQWDNLETNYGHNLIFCGRKEACELHIGSEDRLLASIFNIQPEPTCNYTLKWGVYDQDFNLIVQPQLDEKPIKPMIKTSPRSKSFTFYEKYFVLKKGDKFGVLCNDGRWIANIQLSKKQAAAMINKISGRWYKDLYI